MASYSSQGVANCENAKKKCAYGWVENDTPFNNYNTFHLLAKYIFVKYLQC